MSALEDAARPRISKPARAFIVETIEASEAMGDTQEADALRFLLEYHDNVHKALGT